MDNSRFSVPFTILSIMFCLCFIIDSFLELKVVEVYGIPFTAGMIIIALTYVVNDCIVEVYGYQKARLLLWITFIAHAVSVGLLQLACWLPSPSYWEGAEHFNFIFGLAPRITIASMIAFVVGSSTNAYVMSKMKVIYDGKYFKIRAIASTIAGESVDAAVFFTIGFLGILPFTELLIMIAVQATGKCLCEALVLPITERVVAHVKKVDNVDTYDTNISYNPLSLKV